MLVRAESASHHPLWTFGSDLGYLGCSSLSLTVPVPSVTQGHPETQLRYPSPVPCSLSLSHFKFASYWRATTSLHPELSPPNLPSQTRPANPPFSTMIVAAKRKVLDGLNRRYIYGRVVGFINLCLPLLSPPPIYGWCWPDCRWQSLWDKPALTRCLRLAPSAHHNIPHRDGGSYPDCREV